jgi:hypothetical protein
LIAKSHTKDTLKLLKIQQIISNNIRQRYFYKGWLSMALFYCKTAPSLRAQLLPRNSVVDIPEKHGFDTS